MNQNTATTPPAQEKPTANPLAALLKNPERLASTLTSDRDCWRTGFVLLLGALALYAAFGMASGLFGGWSVSLMTTVKAPMIGLGALLVSFPSLYVFSCVGGAALSVSQVFMLGAASLAMTALLLAGLAPVAWLFAVSTESLPFVVWLNLFIWLTAVCFAVRLITKLRVAGVFPRSGGIKFWFVIFIMVALQMTTCLRPVLTAPTKGWWTSEKKFFLSHFASCYDDKPGTTPAVKKAGR